MRVVGIAVVAIMMAGPSVAQSSLGFESRESFATTPDLNNYRLGGSADSAAGNDEPASRSLSVPTLRLSIPTLVEETSITKHKTPFGGLAVIFGESWSGRDIFHLGTALTRGQTTAGVKVSYEDGQQDRTSSELFVDYALSERFSLGLSGVLSDNLEQGSTPVPQIGVNAEVTSENGLFLQGAIADAEENNPIFGWAIGFKF